MNISRILVSVATAGLMCSVGAQVAEAAPSTVLGGGSGIRLSDGAYCSVAAVGHDRSGRLVALTAGHCAADGGDPLNTLVESEQAPGAGTIGRFAYLNPALDYAVIELDPAKVAPTRTVGRTTITGIAAFPTTGATVCDDGRTTGFGCGPVLSNHPNGTVVAYACAGPGDSGGPITVGDKLVGMIVAGQTYGVLPSCNESGLLHAPVAARPIAAILDDLNSRSVPGSGFQPI